MFNQIYCFWCLNFVHIRIRNTLLTRGNCWGHSWSHSNRTNNIEMNMSRTYVLKIVVNSDRVIFVLLQSWMWLLSSSKTWVWWSRRGFISFQADMCPSWNRWRLLHPYCCHCFTVSPSHVRPIMFSGSQPPTGACGWKWSSSLTFRQQGHVFGSGGWIWDTGAACSSSPAGTWLQGKGGDRVQDKKLCT